MNSVSHPNTSQDVANGKTSESSAESVQIAQSAAGGNNHEVPMVLDNYGSQTGLQSPSDESQISMEMKMAEESASGTDPSLGPTAKLIVNYLPQTLTDDEFRGMFLSVGQVKSSKVCRDRETGFSYGFGFVEFHAVADATKAIELLNGHQMGHKRLKVAYSRPPTREMHEANLYMRGLPKTWGEEQLKDWCSKYGEIIQVRVLKDQTTGLSRGTGFVLFNRKTEADACRAEMTGILLPDCSEPLVVKVAEGPGGNEQKVRPPPGVPVATSMLLPQHPHVAHPLPFQQPPTMPGDHINRYFQQPFGVAAQPSVGGPVRTGTSTPRMRYNPMMSNSSIKMHMMQQAKQPAVMSYSTNSVAPNVASTAEMIGLNTPILPVAGTAPRSVARPPPPPPSYSTARSLPGSAQPTSQLAQFDCPSDLSTSAASAGSGYQLFVYNCGTTCDEKELYELFGPYGAISKIDVVRDPMNGNTKFAFVTMLDYNSAAQAVQALNGYCYTPRPLQVKFKNPLQGPTPGRG